MDQFHLKSSDHIVKSETEPPSNTRRDLEFEWMLREKKVLLAGAGVFPVTDICLGKA